MVGDYMMNLDAIPFLTNKQTSLFSHLLFFVKIWFERGSW
jgi:hypothetical protein